MAPSRRTWFDERGLTIAAGDGNPERHLELYLGAMHYWRTPPASWRAGLAALRDLGLTAVESPVPWRVHEPALGRFAWTAERDLRRFVELAAAAGLAVVLRPGPSANAELTGFGFPDDVLRDPDLAARTAHGSLAWLPAPPRSAPVPSYASEKLHARVRRWYQAVAQQVADLAAPEGPLVALVVDSDAQQLFRRGAYDLDYHPEMLARWAALHPRWPEPPRAWAEEDAARCLTWVRFQRAQTAAALGRFGAALDEVGFAGVARLATVPLAQGVAPAHGAPGLQPGLPSTRSLATAVGGPVAVTSHGPASAAAVRRAALRSLGDLTPLPLALESGCGEAPWMPPAGGADADRRRALALLAAGCRGLGFSMAVERERWTGGLLEADGTLAPDAGWAPRLLAALRELDWTSLRRRPAIAVISSAADAELADAACLVDPFTPVAGELLGLGHEALATGAATGAITARRWQHAVEQALERAGVAYEFLDETATADELAGYRAVVAPLGERVSRALWRTLREVAEQQRAIVVLGPAPPSLDEHGQPLAEPPLRRTGKMRPGSLEDLEGLAADLAQLAGEPASWRCPDERAVISLAADAAGRPRALFLHNDGAASTFELSTSEPRVRALRDPLAEETFPLTGAARIPMAAGDLRLLIIERGP